MIGDQVVLTQDDEIARFRLKALRLETLKSIFERHCMVIGADPNGYICFITASATGSGIYDTEATVWQGREVTARTATTISEPTFNKNLKRLIVAATTRTLIRHGAVPFETVNFQCFENLLGRTRLFTRRINVLNADEPSATPFTCFEEARNGGDQ